MTQETEGEGAAEEELQSNRPRLCEMPVEQSLCVPHSSSLVELELELLVPSLEMEGVWFRATTEGAEKDGAEGDRYIFLESL